MDGALLVTCARGIPSKHHRAADEEDVKGIFPTRQRQSGKYPILFSFGVERCFSATVKKVRGSRIGRYSVSSLRPGS